MNDRRNRSHCFGFSSSAIHKTDAVLILFSSVEVSVSYPGLLIVLLLATSYIIFWE